MGSERGIYPWRWRLDYLLRGLNIERSCSAHAFTTCWLIDELASWNKALRATSLVLTEFEPGKLSLRFYEDRGEYEAGYLCAGKDNDGAFLTAWLPRRHQCINEILVRDGAHLKQLSFVSSAIVGPAPNLQRVVFYPRNTLEPQDSKFLQALGPPQCLSYLDFTNVSISDAVAPKVAEVLRKNTPTIDSVKFVRNQLSPESAGTLLLALVNCERLQDLTLQDSTKFSTCDAMAEVFRSNRVIQKLCMVGLCEEGIKCKHPSRSVTNGRRSCLRCLADVFGALAGLLSLHHMTLQETAIDDTMGEALAQFLTGHCPLQTLSLQSCSFSNTGATLIAEALSANCTLEYVKLHSCSPESEIFGKMCSARLTNSTLRSLILPEINSRSSLIQEGGPTLQLLKQEGPDRVQFSLLVDRPSLVSSALAQAIECAAKVKICRGRSLGVLCSVYNSLALNHSLHALHIDYENGRIADDGDTPGAAIGALCTLLKACGRLQTFHLDVHEASDKREKTAPLLAEVFGALKHNPCLKELSLVTSELSLNTAQSLNVLVGQCKRSLVELNIVSTGNISHASLGVLNEMVTANVFLSRISLRCSVWNDLVPASAAIDDIKERNLCLLNKAAQFVMSFVGGPAASAKHRCAAAFDKLYGTAALREHLVALSGKSDIQVHHDLNSAMCYLQDNYMAFAGVVRTAVVCDIGGSSTQLDGLNLDCWRAIAQYLKIRDVVRL